MTKAPATAPLNQTPITGLPPEPGSTEPSDLATTGHCGTAVMASRVALLTALALGASGAGSANAAPKGDAAVIQLLQTQECRGCKLADADLVHAQLRDADLEGAKLQRANLSQAQLDGANLRNANLSYTSLQGASLRGADLTGSRLVGTDLRGVDLTGAVLDANALEEAHWQGAQGIAKGSRSHATVHNAGVEAFQAGRWSKAEQLFSDAVRIDPDEPLSWIARGISRSEQAKDNLAAKDFIYAANIYQTRGAKEWALELTIAAENIQKRRFKDNSPHEGDGIGGKLLQGTINGMRMLAPIAAKALIPLGLGL